MTATTSQGSLSTLIKKIVHHRTPPVLERVYGELERAQIMMSTSSNIKHVTRK